jgi:hypothetical protein
MKIAEMIELRMFGSYTSDSVRVAMSDDISDKVQNEVYWNLPFAVDRLVHLPVNPTIKTEVFRQMAEMDWFRR